MKKISKILVILVTFIAAIGVAKAEQDCSNVVMYGRNENFLQETVHMRLVSGGAYERNNIIKLDNGSSYLPTYCYNPAKPAGQISGKDTSFSCKRVVFDTTDEMVTTDLRKKYDAGVIEILKTGYKNGQTSFQYNGKTISGNNAAAATDLAIKSYELLWPASLNSNNSSTGSNINYLKALQAYTNKILDNSEIQQKSKSAIGEVHQKYANVNSAYEWQSNGLEIEEAALYLINKGLDASIYFKENGAAYITWNENPVVTKNATIANGNNNKNYYASLAYTFKINKFLSNGAFANVKFNCSNCTANNINYIIKANDTEVDKNNSVNLLNYINNGSGEVTLKIEFTSNSSNYNCDDLEYTIDISYYDKTISNEAYVMHSDAKECAGGTCQNLYVLNRENVTKTATIKDSIALCNITCAELKAQCDAAGSSSSACKQYREKYPNGCVNCGVGIVNNECSNPGETTKLDLIEGYEVDPTNCSQGTEANITGCILDNNDPAGNSYVDNNLSNDYCSVSCKEDFHFTLPGNIDVTSGRYFTLKTDVTGTKTCYLKMKKDSSSVISSFKEGAKNSINAYNNYQKALALSKLNENSSECKVETKRETKNASKYYGSGVCMSTVKEGCIQCNMGHRKTRDEAINACSQNTTGTVYEAKVISCEYKYSGYSSSGASIELSDTYTSGALNCDDKTCNPVDGVFPSDESSDSKEALCSLTAKTSSYEITVPGVAGVKVYAFPSSYKGYSGGSAESIYNGLGSINSCALWEMDYDFNPDLYYSYEESYMANVLTQKLDLVGNITKGNTTHYYCASNDNDSSYELCNGRKDGWSTTPIFRTERIFVCSCDGCKWESITVNNTVRMKEAIDISASYITPTQFYTIYPHGAPVGAKSADGIEGASELTNALPIGLGTSQGIHHYALYAKNLGEYFGTGKFGRVWDTDNNKSVVAATLKETNKCVNQGALKYDADVYSYIKNGVYVCDYNVNTNSCVKTISDSGKITYRDKEGNITDEATYNRVCVCPDCPVTCDKNGCTCSGDKCPVTCPTCIYNNGKNFGYRPISTNDLNPNNRNLGANWSYDDKQISTALEMKAYATTEEIITDGESIYDESTNKYVMKITMDSAMINTIKNRKNKDYSSNTLKCYDYTQDGKTYNNIFCYSTYLDELLNDSKNKTKITFSTDRPFSEAERKNSQNSNYWTTWTKKLENSKWNITTTRELSYYKSNYGEIGIGPSWK